MSKSYEMDMSRGAIFPKLLAFSLPLMLSGILQLLFNAADVIVVGRFVGSDQMAAVGSTSSLINLIVNFFGGLSVGVSVLAAQNYAAGQGKELSKTISTAFMTALLSGLLLILIGTALARPLLELMGSPSNVIEYSTIYLRIYFLGMPALMVYDFTAGILRAAGDTKRPLYYQLAAGAVNVVLNLLFVLVLRIGVAGVAISTTISQIISAFCLFLVLVRDKGKLHLDLKRLRIYPDKLRSIIRVGLPAGLQGTVFSLSNVVIQSAINSFGSVAMAGATASQNIEGFVYIAMNSIYQTNLSFTSQNIGAGKYSRINRILLDCLGAVTLIGLVLGGLVNLFAPQLLTFYTTDPEVARFARERLFLITAPYFLCGIMDTIVGSLRGIGYSLEPMLVSLIGACGSRILFIMTLFQLPYFHSLHWLYIGYPVSWALTFACHLATFIIVRRRLPKTDTPETAALS